MSKDWQKLYESLQQEVDDLKKENGALKVIVEGFKKDEAHRALRDKATEVQMENYNFLRTVVDTMDSLLFVVAPDGLILHINATVSKITGISAADIMGYQISDFINDNDMFRFDVEKAAQFRFSNLESVEVDLQLEGKAPIPLLLSVSALYNSSGVVTSFVFLARDYTKLKLAKEMLIKSEEEARLLAEAKSSFLSSMSHELRTPLNAIIGYSELIREDHNENCLDFPQAMADIERIFQSGRHLLGLVNDVLDISKVESGEVRFLSASFSLKDVAHQVRDIVLPIANQKGNEILIELASDVDTIVGDEGRVRQILINLMSNAAKYTTDGKVTLKVSRTIGSDSLFRFEVIDTGMGISEENLASIFDKFVQVHDTSRDPLAGAGLGLPLTKSLVELMGGSISVSSQLGKGASFVVELGDNSTIATTEEDNIDGARTSVLIVEDNQDVREYMAELLQEHCECETAVNGYEALCILENRRYDILLVDHHMPNMTGLNLIQMVRERGISAHRTFLLTGTTMERVFKKAQSLGVDRVFKKPMDEEEILAAILQPDSLKKVS